MSAGILQDRIGRTACYLRLSLTSACPMACLYCRPAMLGEESAAPRLLPAEIESLVRHLVCRHGLRKVRLTGGEPTTRPDLMEIIGRLRAIDGLDELALTTNGLTLSRQARAMADAGLDRINVSLDSLDPQRFRRMTGMDTLGRVIEGIDAALAAGLAPVKLNCVVVRGENDGELPDLARFAADHGLEIRFIELMPMGPLAQQWARRYVPETEMRQRLEGLVREWSPVARRQTPARRHRVVLDDGRAATIGFITPMSCHFCEDCNRIRIASDGTFYPCLMDRPAGSVLRALRPRLDEQELDRVLAVGLAIKAPVHPVQGHGVMVQIGG